MHGANVGRRYEDRHPQQNWTSAGRNPTAKGAMREPTQQAGAVGDREELKQALQDLEESKGDWSKGG
jgi:hypothetical protein